MSKYIEVQNKILEDIDISLEQGRYNDALTLTKELIKKIKLRRKK